MMMTRSPTCLLIPFLCVAASAHGGGPATAPARPLRLTVLMPDGTPAAGARAVVVPAGRYLVVTDGRTFDDDPAYARATADVAGRVDWPAVTPPFLVCVISDAGSVDVEDRHLPADGAVRLSAWASIEGVVRTARTPVPKITVKTRSDHQSADDDFALRPTRPTIRYEADAVSDADGRYVVPRVAAGRTSVLAWRPLTDWRRFATTPTTFVDVPAGGTEAVDLGGRGRAVVGRAVVPEGFTHAAKYVVDFGKLEPPPMDIEPPPAVPAGLSMKQADAWSRAPQQVDARRRVTQSRIERTRRRTERSHEFSLAADGTFRVDDVLPGTYRLSYGVCGPMAADHTREVFAEPHIDVVVPDDGRDTPVDVGDIVATAGDGGRVGKTAFAFDAPGLDDRPVRLADYRGRFVLIDFWATWCGPCVAEEPNLRAVYDRFGRDPRLAMIGLCEDDTPGPPLAHVAKEKIPWRQAFLGGTDGPVSKAYGVEGIPTILLIGPDGRIVADELRGDAIEKAIARALAE